MNKKVIFLAIFPLMLVGCASKVQYTTLVDKEPVSIPEQFFVKPELPPPPEKDYYLSLSPELKEKALGAYIIRLLGTVKDSFTVIDNLKQYNDEQVKIIKDSNNKKVKK